MTAAAPETAFDLDFDAWPPASPPVKHGLSAPLGAIRYARKGRSTHRQIKVRMDGPPARRWMKLARYWWLKHMGPVPEGKRVCHADGDTLNDDPHNYELMTAGDVICLQHLNNPTWSERQHRRCAIAASEHNRERMALIRHRRWLPSHWYPVDLAGRRIHNDPMRQRWQVYAAAGCDVGALPNGAGVAGAVLGWPGLTAIDAVALAALVDAGRSLVTGDVWAALCQLYAVQRWSPPRRCSTLYSGLTRLRRDGLVSTSRGGRGQSRHRATAAAVQRRKPVCPLIAVRGDELHRDPFDSFTRVSPGAGAEPARKGAA